MNSSVLFVLLLAEESDDERWLEAQREGMDRSGPNGGKGVIKWNEMN